ncbi:MAG: Hsp20/alpha crystallin family protein [Nitrososphaeraceae archaeon]
MTLDYWNRQIEIWMDVFSDDKPDLMALEIVREFDNLTKKFYGIFDDDLNEWGESTEIYMGIRSEVVKETVDIVLNSSYPEARPNKNAKVRKFKRKIETLPVSGKAIESRIEKVEKDFSEDVIVSDKNIKIVFQLPINNKKENVKVVANETYSITISHLNNEGKRCIRTLDIPYNIDSEAAKATYKNGILEVKFDRQ